MKSEALYLYPEHKIITQRLQQQIEVWLDGDIIAQTHNAIIVKETGYEDIIYVPKNDLKNIDLLKSGDYDCPFKGHAELYNIKHRSKQIENAALSYENPYDQVQELQGRVAFYPDKIQEIKIY